MFDEYHNCSHLKKQEHLTKYRLMKEDILMMIFEGIFLYGHVFVAFAGKALELDKTLETKEIIHFCLAVLFVWARSG